MGFPGKKHYLAIAAAWLAGCSPPPAQTAGEQQAAPGWVRNHPRSESHFVGVGSARIGSNLEEAQKRARDKALYDIAEQIQVKIIGDVKSHESSVVHDGVMHRTDIWREKVQTMATAVIEEWELKRTWQSPDGYYWTMVVYNKATYYNRLYKKVNDAIALATDALAAARSGSAGSRLTELHRALQALDDFLGVPVKATVGGKDVVLTNEVPRRIAEVFEALELVPTAAKVVLAATAPVPETLGVYVRYRGKTDRSLDVSWSSSDSRVGVNAQPVRDDGLHPVEISSVPASAGMVTVTAQLSLEERGRDFAARGIESPTGAFTVQRATPRVAAARHTEVCRGLLERLASKGAITVAAAADAADYVLDAEIRASGEPVLAMGIFRAKATVSAQLRDSNGTTVLDLYKEVSAGDARSAQQARRNAERLAVEEAVKKVEGAF